MTFVPQYKVATTQPESGKPIAFADLWESWRDPMAEIIQSCTIPLILTSSAQSTTGCR